MYVPTLSKDRHELEPGTRALILAMRISEPAHVAVARWQEGPQVSLAGTTAGRRPGPRLEKAHHYLRFFPFQQNYCDVSFPLVWPIFPTSPCLPLPPVLPPCGTLQVSTDDHETDQWLPEPLLSPWLCPAPQPRS